MYIYICVSVCVHTHICTESAWVLPLLLLLLFFYFFLGCFRKDFGRLINLSLDEWGPSVPSAATCLNASLRARSQQGNYLTFQRGVGFSLPWFFSFPLSLIIYCGTGEYQKPINWAWGSIIKWVKTQAKESAKRKVKVVYWI